MKSPRWLQPEHFEYRYLVPENQREEMGVFLEEYLEPDEHGLDRRDHCYRVHDYYLDNDRWDVYWRSLEMGARNPSLRFRCYGDDPNSAIYAESKRHLHDRVIKHSTEIPRADLELLLSGLMPDPCDLAPGPVPEVDLEHFCHSLSQHQAALRIHVAFEREAWRNQELSEHQLRVTLDHQCQCASITQPDFAVAMEAPQELYPARIVLELKFIERYPEWFRELTRRFHCQPMGTTKFIKSAQLLGGAALSSGETTLF